MACLFCDIIAGRAEAAVVLRDPRTVVFLDSRPLFPGHCLVAPVAHYETLLDLPAELIGPLFATARRVAQALETALGAEGSFVAVNNRVSQSVLHLHVHVVPRRPKDGLKGFFWPRQKYEGPEHVAAVLEKLKAALAA